MKVLWLASWYPNKADQWNGDFIQRHAKAVAQFCDVTVIHLAQTENELQNEDRTEGRLTEKIIYYRADKTLFGKVVNQFIYFQKSRKAVEAYVATNGVPAVVHVHVPVKAGIVGLWMKRKYKVPLVVTEHWAIYNEFAFDAFYKRNKWFQHWTKKIIRNADRLLPVSDELGRSINKWVMRKAFTVVPNVVDTQLFRFAPSKGDKFRFVHVSTMIWQKQPEIIIDTFIQLLNEYPHAELQMIGPYPQEVYDHAKATGELERSIFFTGSLVYAQVATQLQQANAFVLFSRYENLPCVILEALCCGLPVISSNVGGISEVIDQQNGLLVNQQPSALHAAMQNIIVNYQTYQREEMAIAAQQKFSYSTVGQQVYTIYQELH